MTGRRLSGTGEIGEALAQARRDAGLTQEELAAWAGLRRRYISELESSPSSLQVRRLIDLFAVLGYELLAVPAGTEPHPPNAKR